MQRASSGGVDQCFDLLHAYGWCMCNAALMGGLIRVIQAMLLTGRCTFVGERSNYPTQFLASVSITDAT
eukprot:scaffold408163_cov32-Prasinocladus_malaysianus.AAC.2